MPLSSGTRNAIRGLFPLFRAALNCPLLPFDFHVALMGQKAEGWAFFVLLTSARHGLLSSPRQGAYAAERVRLCKSQLSQPPKCQRLRFRNASSGEFNNDTPRSKISQYCGCFLLLHSIEEPFFHRLQSCCTMRKPVSKPTYCEHQLYQSTGIHGYTT